MSNAPRSAVNTRQVGMKQKAQRGRATCLRSHSPGNINHFLTLLQGLKGIGRHLQPLLPPDTKGPKAGVEHRSNPVLQVNFYSSQYLPSSILCSF